MREYPRAPDSEAPKRIRTGIEGLDSILCGGLPPGRIFLVEGTPGTGKTTLALQFLLEGLKQGENTLYVTLSETKDELLDVARSHGWSLEGVGLYELEAVEDLLKPEDQYTVFQPAEVELGQTIKRIGEQVEDLEPSRVVLDSLSEIRLIAQNPLRYRRQILALKQFFKGRKCTVLLLDDCSSGRDDVQLESIAHGVILLEQYATEYGPTRRRLQVRKMRGVGYSEGYHDFKIRPGGLTVYPRLDAAGHKVVRCMEEVLTTSELPELHALTGGGLQFGSSVLILGPAGSGKSMLATQYALAAVRREICVSCYLFEESEDTFLNRASALGMDLSRFRDRLAIQRVDPAELSPGEFACKVRESVEDRMARVVIIDSLNGYLNAMPSDRFLIVQMHELLSYLGERNVLALLVLAQHGLVSTAAQAEIDLSYLADTVVLLRYFEAAGAVRQAISIIKKRVGLHEHTIRELLITDGGLRIGPPLRDFQGVLTGTPRYKGAEERLFEVDENGVYRRQ
jgi:circadian clock protein KaiC